MKAGAAFIFIGIVGIVAILAIAFIFRPKCVQVGGECDSSPLQCCSNLECINNICSLKLEDRYTKFNDKVCNVRNQFLFEKPLLDDPSLKGKTFEEVVKAASERCDECRDNTQSHTECSNVKCGGFYFIEGPNGPTWKDGVAFGCISVTDPAFDTSKSRFQDQIGTTTFLFKEELGN